jgi:AraC-like DNA-binding protein
MEISKNNINFTEVLKGKKIISPKHGELVQFPVSINENLKFKFPLAHYRKVVAPLFWADVRPHSRLFFILKCPKKSNNFFTDGLHQQKITIQSGQVIYLPPSVFIKAEHHAGLELVAFHVQTELIPGEELFAHQQTFLKFNASKEIRQLTQLLTSSSVGAALGIQALCLEFLSRAADSYRLQVNKILAWEEKYNSLRIYVRDHAVHGLKVNDLALRLGLNRSTLSREFSKQTGMSLKNYLDREVLDQAKRYLSTTELSIRQIADRLEFSDEYFFSHFFKRKTGQSPTLWREAAQKSVS